MSAEGKRVIIAGCRDFNNYDTLVEAINEAPFAIGTILSGGASGVDALGERYAREKNLPLLIYKADWARYGRAAGPMRNRQMAENANALIALWDSSSPGTRSMIDIANTHNLAVFVKYI